MTGKSLKEYDDLVGRIVHHRRSDPKPVLIVEGPDDALVLRSVMKGVAIFPAAGKANVLSAAVALNKRSFQKFKGVVDNDFDPVLPKNMAVLTYPYLGRDLEAMLVGIGVLSEILEHQGSAVKISNSGGVSNILAIIKSEVRAITNLRIANSLNQWGLAFDKVDLSSKIDKKTLRLNLVGYVTALLAASDSSCAHADLINVASAAVGPGSGDFGGKDFVEFAAVALRSKIGSLSHAAACRDVLLPQLRSSSGLAMSKTPWVASLDLALAK